MSCARANSYARKACSAVEIITKELTLDIDINQFNEATTRQQLAALYGIDTSLISLAVIGGSVQLAVTIASSSGSAGSALPIADLAATINSVGDTTLAATLGVPVTSSAAQQRCPPGSVLSSNAEGANFCTTANILDANRAATCPPGKQELGGICIPCVKGHYCIGGMAVRCPSGFWLNASGATNLTWCKACPARGVSCVTGDTIEVLQGFYMQTPDDISAFPCASAGSCIGGPRFGDEGCAAGHGGALCGTCNDGYYRSQRRCLSCATLDTGRGTSAADTATDTVIAIVVVSIAVPLLTITYLQPPHCITKCVRIIGSTTLATRVSEGLITAAALAKVLISYCQCIGALNRISGVRWPVDFLRFMEVLDRTFNLELFAVLPPECVYGSRLGFYVELLVTLLLPIAILLVLFTLIFLHRWLARRHGWKLEGGAAVSTSGWAGLRSALARPRVCKLLIWVRIMPTRILAPCVIVLVLFSCRFVHLDTIRLSSSSTRRSCASPWPSLTALSHPGRSGCCAMILLRLAWRKRGQVGPRQQQ